MYLCVNDCETRTECRGLDVSAPVAIVQLTGEATLGIHIYTNGLPGIKAAGVHGSHPHIHTQKEKESEREKQE